MHAVLPTFPPERAGTKITCTSIFRFQNERDVFGSGDVMQLAHRKHYAKFRLRCVKERCGLVFCGGCGAQPYHEGYTCDEWQRRADGLSCRFVRILSRAFAALFTALIKYALRFCDSEVRGDAAKYGGWVVCASADCQRHASQSCTASLSCGHVCCGTIGENIRSQRSQLICRAIFRFVL